MQKEPLVFEVNDASYGKYVLLNSHKLPVIMCFTAVWSEQCFVVDNLFTGLAEEFAEKFVFARLDVEQNPETRDRYDIHELPTLLVFSKGEVARREQGMTSEDEARSLLKDFGVYRESDEKRLAARRVHMQGDTPRAITLMAEAMKADPTNTRIALDMVQIFVDIREFDEADKLFSRLPQSDIDSRAGRSLSGQLKTHRLAARTEGVAALTARIQADAADYDARFDLSLCLAADNNYPEAMNHLFYILEHQADYREGAAREMIVSLINSMTENSPDMAQLYRRQLATALNE